MTNYEKYIKNNKDKYDFDCRFIAVDIMTGHPKSCKRWMCELCKFNYFKNKKDDRDCIQKALEWLLTQADNKEMDYTMLSFTKEEKEFIDRFDSGTIYVKNRNDIRFYPNEAQPDKNKNRNFISMQENFSFFTIPDGIMVKLSLYHSANSKDIKDDPAEKNEELISKVVISPKKSVS